MHFLSLCFLIGNSYSLSRDTKRGFLFPQIVFDRRAATRNKEMPDPCDVKTKQRVIIIDKEKSSLPVQYVLTLVEIQALRAQG